MVGVWCRIRCLSNIYILMKKILDYRLYDTDKAKYVWAIEHKTFIDKEHYVEILYVTRKGNYFVHGRGNSESRYKKIDENGNNLKGEDIWILSRTAARDWILNNGGTETDYECNIEVMNA